MEHDGPAGDIRRPELSDEVLAARAAGGDPHAFERLVRRHQRHMYTVALRITGRPADAEDATQNAFSAAWRRLPTFKGESTFATWMYRITTNHAMNQVRARRRSDRQADLYSLPDTDQPLARSPGPEQRGMSTALRNDLRTALEALPAELRVCWVAREIDGLSYQEVATVAGVGLDVARGRIFRARRRLASAMEPWR